MPAPTHPPRKRFGQHFLHDPGAIARIVRAVQPHPGEPLVEIGPGLGAITLPLLDAAGRLDAVELDRDLIPELQRLAQGHGELRIHSADALQFDFAQLRTDEQRLRVVGNLPYNITTPLLFHLLEQAEHISDMHFLLQKEVVERMAAGPGRPAYGRLSVMVQLHCRVEPLFTLGRGAFRPAPQVESTCVRLIPHAEPLMPVAEAADLAEVVRAAFSQRRKTLRNALRPLLDAAAILAAGIDPNARPETLGLAGFAALGRQLDRNRDYNRCTHPPPPTPR